MTWSEIAVVVVAVVLVLLWWVWTAANRLDRLHRKVATSRAALDNQLVRRASVAAEVAASGLLDPVSSVLVTEAAWAALWAGGSDEAGLPGPTVAGGPPLVAAGGPPDGPVDRDQAESELSRTLRTALDEHEVEELGTSPLGEELVGALVASWYRVQLARRFHNEAVAQTQRMRRKALVRLLRLHGHAPVPATVEIDDAWPEAFDHRVQR